jgi:hypothetical protein
VDGYAYAGTSVSSLEMGRVGVDARVHHGGAHRGVNALTDLAGGRKAMMVSMRRGVGVGGGIGEMRRWVRGLVSTLLMLRKISRGVALKDNYA